MSNLRTQGPLSAIFIPISEEIARHGALQPYQKNCSRAEWGAFFLAGSGYVAWWSPVFLGGHFRDLVDAFLRTPTDPPLGLAVCAGCFALGLLWLVVGLKGARGPSDGMKALWAAAMVGGFGCLIWWQVYLPPDLGGPYALGSFVLHGLYLTMIVSSLVRMGLALRGTGGDAQRAVQQQIERNERQVDSRPAALTDGDVR